MAYPMYYKSKTGQLIKIEKENENFELRKRMRSSTKDKHLTNKKETVWERLSKVKKIPSTENTLGITRSRNNLTTRASQRFETIRKMVINQTQQHFKGPELQIVNCVPLSPKNGRSYSRRSNATDKFRLPQKIVGPEIENPKLSYACKPDKSVNELITSRSLGSSKSSSDDCNPTARKFADTISPHFSVHGKIEDTILSNIEMDNYSEESNDEAIAMTNNKKRESSEDLNDEYKLEAVATTNRKMDESSEDSTDEYKLAPLMSSRSNYDLNSSTLIRNKFRNVLRHKNKSMALDDIELVKDVIKSDQRYQNLNENDPQLFKDILKTQLEDILKHEIAVKKALNKLESSASLQSSQELQITNIQPIELTEIVSYSDKQPQKLEVDVIFKNVPSLEKEIIILRTLGEKLEATLRSTTSHKDCGIKTPQTETLSTSPPVILEKVVFLVVSNVIHYVEIEAQVLGKAHHIGIVKEFCIAQKSLVELQQEVNCPFYIPINPKTADLKRTSFKKLKENPDILLRHVKAKTSKVTFNVLDQDPVFFNNVLFNQAQTWSNHSLTVSTNEEYYIENISTTNPILCEGGDSRICQQTEGDEDFSQKTLILKESGNKPVVSIVKSDTPLKPFKSVEPVIRGKQRRRIRGSLTPMPDKNTNPKNNLFKTILIGFIQMQLFILLIIAFTYPDLKC